MNFISLYVILSNTQYTNSSFHLSGIVLCYSLKCSHTTGHIIAGSKSSLLCRHNQRQCDKAPSVYVCVCVCVFVFILHCFFLVGLLLSNNVETSWLITHCTFFLVTYLNLAYDVCRFIPTVFLLHMAPSLPFSGFCRRHCWRKVRWVTCFHLMGE